MKSRVTISVYTMSITGEYLGSQQEDIEVLRIAFTERMYYYWVKYTDSIAPEMVPGDDSGPYGVTYQFSDYEIRMYATYEFGVMTFSKEPITQQQRDERDLEDEMDLKDAIEMSFHRDVVQEKKKTTKRVSFK